jgi:methyltransferase
MMTGASSFDLTRLLLVAALCYGPMLIEAARARRHEARQRARGAVEPRGDVYRLMQWAYPGVFLAMLVEAAWVGTTPSAAMFATGLATFAAGKALKWWAILTLGEHWTFRILVLPGSSPISGGPYRWMAHPNYVGVVGELAGVALMTAAAVAGPLGAGLFVALMVRRAAVEQRARDAILRRR